LIKIIENENLNLNTFFGQYLIECTKNLKNKRNNNNVWSSEIINFMKCLQFYSSWKTIDFLKGNNDKEEEIVLNKNLIQQKYSKGINSNFNFLLPSKSCVGKKKSNIKFGNFINKLGIKNFIEKIKINSTEPKQPFFFSFDGTAIRSGYVKHKSGYIFGGANPIKNIDFNSDKIFENKSKEMIVIFINFPLIKLSFPVSVFNIFSEKNENLIFKYIDHLVKIFEDPYLVFKGIITDDSPVSSSTFVLLKNIYKDIIHIKDYKHLIKNLRNSLLSKKIQHNNDGIGFNLRDLVSIIHDCPINISCIRPYDKMDESLVNELLSTQIFDCCKNQENECTKRIGIYLSYIKKFKDLINYYTKERSEDIQKYFENVNISITTKNSILETLLMFDLMKKEYPNLELSELSTNPIENFFSIMKKKNVFFFYFFLIYLFIFIFFFIYFFFFYFFFFFIFFFKKKFY
jgi:hypothetical protein